MTHATAPGVWTAQPSDMLTKAVLDRVNDWAFMQRFYAKVDLGFTPEDCHIWTGALSDEGYGNFSVGRHTIRAHRVGWMIDKKVPVPSETPFLDHLNCLGRFCVNPRHLEPVDNEENTRRRRNIGSLVQRTARATALRERQARRDAGESWIF